MDQQAEGGQPGIELSRQGMRVSDADRHRVAELLREAAGEGRLDLDELDERLEAAYAAKTYGDLVPITSDLPLRHGESPVPPVLRRQTPPATAAHESSLAVMGDCTRRGPWVVPRGTPRSR
ncbi:MAG: DUF1707 domain-containing protein [Nocardioides sp.]